LSAAFGVERVISEWQRKSRRNRGENPRIVYGVSLLIGAVLVFSSIPNPISPTDAIAGWHNWGVSSSRINLFHEAEEAYQHVLNIAPGHVPTLENLSFVYLKQQNYKDAETTLTTLTKVDPSSYLGQLRMADLKARRGKWDESLVYARRAQALRPDELAPKEQEAEALFVTGDRKTACPMLKEIEVRSKQKKVSMSTYSKTYLGVCEKLAAAGKLDAPSKRSKITARR
jgi:predicted Zn-dependent protease